MVAEMRKIDTLDEDYIARIHGLVSGLLITHMDTLERRIEALEKNQPPTDLIGKLETRNG